MIGQFLLERPPETLHRGIIVTVTFPAYRGYEAMLFQDIPEIMGAVLAAAIRMMQKPLRRPPGFYRPE